MFPLAEGIAEIFLKASSCDSKLGHLQQKWLVEFIFSTVVSVQAHSSTNLLNFWNFRNFLIGKLIFSVQEWIYSFKYRKYLNLKVVTSFSILWQWLRQQIRRTTSWFFLLKVHRKSLSGVLKSHCLGHFGKVPSSAPVGESCFSQAEGRKPVDWLRKSVIFRFRSFFFSVLSRI